MIANGVLGLGLLLLGLSGAIIWWPGILRWKRSLRITRRTNWKRFNWDLHSVVGFWSCAALLVVSFTGVYLIFPETVTRITVAVLGDAHPATKSAERSNTPSASLLKTTATTQCTLDQIIAIGQQAMPEKAPLSYLSFPAVPGGAFTAAQYSSHSMPYSRLVTAEIDPHSGKILQRSDSTGSPLGMRVAAHFTAIHFGWFGGPGILGLLVKILWVLLGLAPAALGITGLIMYWNRFLKQKIRSWRRPRQIHPAQRKA